MAIQRQTSNYHKNSWYPPVSYHLWQLFTPSVGYENLHCDTKRGFEKARNKEPEIKRLLLQDSQPQNIGKLAQRGVYQFHQDTLRLSNSNGVEQVTEILQLSQELPETQERVLLILKHYYQQPILANKNIIHLLSGDEGYPKPVFIQQGNYQFNLFPAFDCIFREDDETIHILDFKTGKSNFDRRQAYVYLLAAQYLYTNQKAVASFYNLETQEWSEKIYISFDAVEVIKIELSLISKKHQRQLQAYRNNPEHFYGIFPANAGYGCRYCPFTSICNYYRKVK